MDLHLSYGYGVEMKLEGVELKLEGVKRQPELTWISRDKAGNGTLTENHVKLQNGVLELKEMDKAGNGQ